MYRGVNGHPCLNTTGYLNLGYLLYSKSWYYQYPGYQEVPKVPDSYGHPETRTRLQGRIRPYTGVNYPTSSRIGIKMTLKTGTQEPRLQVPRTATQELRLQVPRIQGTLGGCSIESRRLFYRVQEAVLEAIGSCTRVLEAIGSCTRVLEAVDRVQEAPWRL